MSKLEKSRKKEGICHLAGAGPGDLGLVTLRTRELVEQAEVIVYDYLCNPAILAWAPPAAEIIYAGKKPRSTRSRRSRSMRCSSKKRAREKRSSG